MRIVTSRWAIKRVVDKGGVYRNRGGTQLIPDKLESEITQRVLELRALKHPVYKEDIKAWATEFVESSLSITDSWYYGYLKRQKLETGFVSCLEQDRANWLKSGNIKIWYDILEKLLLQTKIGEINPDYDEANPRMSPKIKIVKPERIASLDETRIEADMTGEGKHNSLRIVKGLKGDKGVVTVTKSDYCCTGVGGIRADGHLLIPHFIWAMGVLLPVDMCQGGPVSTLGAGLYIRHE
jgi:hypothetical protein